MNKSIEKSNQGNTKETKKIVSNFFFKKCFRYFFLFFPQEYINQRKQEKRITYGFQTKGIIHHFQIWGKYALILVILLGIEN